MSKREEAPGILIGVLIQTADGKDLTRKAIKFPLTDKKYQELLEHQSLIVSLAKGLLTLAGQAMERFATTELSELKEQALRAMEEAKQSKSKSQIFREAIINAGKGVANADN
jgi:hypothetical protein